MKLARTIVLAVLAWPIMLGWLFPLAAMVCGLAHRPRIVGTALHAVWRPWVSTTPRAFLAAMRWPLGQILPEGRTWWKYSQTAGAGLVFMPEATDRTRQHEGVHVNQAQDYAIGAQIVGITFSIVTENAWPYLICALLYWVLYLPNFLTAVLRGGHLYRDAEHERSAYAQTDSRPRQIPDHSWLTEHESQEQKF